MKEKLLIVGLLSILSLSVLVRSEIVEDHKDHIGYTLIKQLYEDTGTAIEELDDQWSKQSVLLQNNINSWQQTVVDQQALCNRRKQDLKNTLKEISKTEHFIEWIAARVRDNDARVERLQELRCRANNLYIDSIKNHRLTLTLVEYLINEINNVQNVEMLQQSQTMTKLSMFINAYKLGSVSHLLDAPVYADFKKHLQQQAINLMEQKSKVHQGEDEDDGEVTAGDDGEASNFSEDEEANQNALREIEHELNSDEDSNETYSVAQEEEDDGECEDDDEEETGSAAARSTRGTSEEGGVRHTHHGEECTQIHDGEFLLDEDDDDEESDDEEDSDDEEEDDDTVSAPASGSSSSGSSSEESEGDSEASQGSEDSAAEGDNDSESSGDSESGNDEDNAAHESEIKSLADEDGEVEGDGAQIYGGNYDWNNEQSGTQGGQGGSGGYHFDGVVKDWPTYKQDILSILTELKENIIQTMRQAQDDEVLAGIALADFKLFIERENRGLERDQADQEDHLENLRTLQKKTEWKIDDCLAEYQTDNDALYVANNEYDGTEVQYQENRAAQVAEREIYEYVLGLYEGRINAYNEPAYSPEDFNDLDDDTPVLNSDNGDGEHDGEDGDGEHDGEDGEDGEAYYVEEEYVVEEEIEELVDEDDF